MEKSNGNRPTFCTAILFDDDDDDFEDDESASGISGTCWEEEMVRPSCRSTVDQSKLDPTKPTVAIVAMTVMRPPVTDDCRTSAVGRTMASQPRSMLEKKKRRRRRRRRSTTNDDGEASDLTTSYVVVSKTAPRAVCVGGREATNDSTRLESF
jgi:Tfp pilus tip-associated adhesin PilY1